MKQNDILWKGIIEDLPEHFVSFFFPDAESLIDFGRGFSFLDKELEALFPDDEIKQQRFVDKLIKAFRKDGTEEWILIHIEVQGYKDAEFGQRMFTYFYRLFEKYGKPITALAIFTDENQAYLPGYFEYNFLGTVLTYRFNTYKIVVQEETKLLNNPNPFALVVLTVLKSIKNSKSNDETLLPLKIDLFRKMFERNMEKSTMRALVNFLKTYIRFSKPETYPIFENEIKLVTNNITTMGVEELILQMAKQEGKAEVVANLIVKMGLTNEQAADIADVSVLFVQQVREKIEMKQKD